MTNGKRFLLLLIFLPGALAQQPSAPPKQDLPEIPIAVRPGPSPLTESHAPGVWTGYVGLGHGKTKGFQPVGSLNYRLSDHYGLFVARTTVSYSGGVSFSFGHKK